MKSFRYNNGTNNDNDKHGCAQQLAAHLVREGHRHIPGDVLRVRVRRAAGVRRRQLHVLGRARQETCQAKEP